MYTRIYKVWQLSNEIDCKKHVYLKIKVYRYDPLQDTLLGQLHTESSAFFSDTSGTL